MQQITYLTALQRTLLKMIYHPQAPDSCTLPWFMEMTDLEMGVVLYNLKTLMTMGLIAEEQGHYLLADQSGAQVRSLLLQTSTKLNEVKEVVETLTTAGESSPQERRLHMEQVCLSDFDFKLLHHHFHEIEKLMAQAKQHRPVQTTEQIKQGHYIFWGYQSSHNYWQGLKARYSHQFISSMNKD